MELAAPCIYCKEHKVCTCRNSLVSYLKSLNEIDSNEVLRVKATSQANNLPVIRSGIDKIDAYFQKPLKISILKEMAEKSNFPIKEKYLREPRPFIEISSGSKRVYLKYSADKEYFRGFTSNPNNFKSWNHYIHFLERIIEPEVLEHTQIHRIDLNIDFRTSLSTLAQSIDIVNKRASVSFNDVSGIRTGYNIGKGTETIVLYDKALQASTKDLCSRLEIRLKGKKLPTRSLDKVPQLIQSNNIFKNIRGVNVSITELHTGNQRIKEFKLCLEREGYYSARKLFNKNSNFKRDYGQLINVVDWDKQPHELYFEEIKGFFGSASANSKLDELSQSYPTSPFCHETPLKTPSHKKV